MTNAHDFETFWARLNQELFVPPKNILTASLTGLMYRGIPDKSYELTTSLQRLNITVQRSNGNLAISTAAQRRTKLQYRERRLIDSFGKYARNLLSFGTTDWDVMLLGQHYRLPTRLLDWTASPLVAMFFATEPLTLKPEKEPDGMIWCISHAATLAMCDETLVRRLAQAKKRTADIEFMSTFGTIEEFDAEPYKSSLLWFEPHSVDQRIINQFAVFSVMQGVDTRVDQWINDNKDVAWCVIIPGEMKTLLRRRLYLLNITDRTLFPGLEGIAHWQKAYYSDD